MIKSGIRGAVLLALAGGVAYEYFQCGHLVLLLTVVALIVLACNDGLTIFRMAKKSRSYVK
jgi:NhaP-type Na+/H+ or K+/H+ antiporter